MSNLRQHCEDYHPKEKSYDLSNLKWKPVEVKESANNITCVVCHKSFARLENLKLHMFAYHFTHRNTHECESCGKSFASNSNLSKHIVIFHPDEDSENDGSRAEDTQNDAQEKANESNLVQGDALISKDADCSEKGANSSAQNESKNGGSETAHNGSKFMKLMRETYIRRRKIVKTRVNIQSPEIKDDTVSIDDKFFSSISTHSNLKTGIE